MTTTQSTPDPQAHATDTEMAIAHLYAAGRHATVIARQHPGPFDAAFHTTADLSYDAIIDACLNLCKTVGADFGTVVDVAKTL